ncbi:malate dehydrogenase [Nocardioides terrisoli]|uniref:malate dehydrogenase n=1 Tax=Nocardioides terrisoli TaxID=3388267 RepID=UPI00287B7C76|nr:malate dehydrogenase [Nocardioides marmorisolisilvae]
MPLVSEYDVRRAAATGNRELYVDADAVVTPQALDIADRLGVDIQHRAAPMGAQPSIDPARAVQRLLLRRSPRWVAPPHRRGLAATRFTRIAFVGSGMVGATAAHLAAISGIADELSLVDVVPGLAAATALDLEHASGITGSATRARGGTSLDLCASADVVVVTAGRPRSPGMTRDALLAINARVIHDIAESIALHAPDAVVIVVTNPLDEMTSEMWRRSALPARQVIGMAGTLDSSRFRNALAGVAGVRPADVQAITLGSHGAEMVPLVSSATIKGRPVRDVLSTAMIDRAVAEAVNGGAAVVELRKTGSAFIAPAHAVMELVDALRGAITDPLPASVMLTGQYGIDGLFLGVRARFDSGGVVEVIEDRLDKAELSALQAAARSVQARLAG